MVLTVLAPVTQLSFSGWKEFDSDISRQVQEAVQAGKESADQALASRISDSVAAYIQNKAKALQADLEIRVELTDGDIPIPCRIYIRGAVSPYAKRKLQALIREELGIEKENQVWT